MEALDCPAGDQMTPVRNNSVTVQQALALWNDAAVLHLEPAIGERLQRQVDDQGRSIESVIQSAMVQAVGRRASTEEVALFHSYIDQHGWSNFCRVLFNLNDFVFVE